MNDNQSYLLKLLGAAIESIVPKTERLFISEITKALMPLEGFIESSDDDNLHLNLTILLTQVGENLKNIVVQYPEFNNTLYYSYIDKIAKSFTALIFEENVDATLKANAANQIINYYKDKIYIHGDEVKELANEQIEYLQRQKERFTTSSVPKKKSVKDINIATTFSLKSIDGDSAMTLVNISLDLHKLGYTLGKHDFEDVFNGKNSKIVWLKEPYFLAYLLRCLYKNNPKIISVTPRSNNYAKAATFYFYMQNNTTLAVAKFYTDAANKIQKAVYPNHRQIKERVESLIKKSIPQKKK